MQLDEQALRRPGFSEGHRVQLGDGGTWTFPLPILRFFPTIADSGQVAIAAQRGHDDRYQQLRDELIETDKDDHFNLMRIQVELAGTLLLKNYSLESKHLGRLLAVIPNNEANDQMWSDLAPVVLAQEPQSFPVGQMLPDSERHRN